MIHIYIESESFEHRSPVAPNTLPLGNSHIPARSCARPPQKMAIPTTTFGVVMFRVWRLYNDNMKVVDAKENKPLCPYCLVGWKQWSWREILQSGRVCNARRCGFDIFARVFDMAVGHGDFTRVLDIAVGHCDGWKARSGRFYIIRGRGGLERSRRNLDLFIGNVTGFYSNIWPYMAAKVFVKPPKSGYITHQSRLE